MKWITYAVEFHDEMIIFFSKMFTIDAHSSLLKVKFRVSFVSANLTYVVALSLWCCMQGCVTLDHVIKEMYSTWVGYHLRNVGTFRSFIVLKQIFCHKISSTKLFNTLVVILLSSTMQIVCITGYNSFVFGLTHCGPVTPNGNIDHWLR